MAHSKTEIVATVGPASGDLDTLRVMINHRMDIMRLNFSHGTHEKHLEYIKALRAAAKNSHRYIPVMQDLSGPRENVSGGHHFRAGATEVITEKDIADLKFGLESGVDLVAMSYVGGAEDIKRLREIMRGFGRVVSIVAKIERAEAMANLAAIVDVADACMVARGDLGTNLPVEKVPTAQREIIAECNKAGKPVIVATQMFLSMVGQNTPTRAEVSDVYDAIMEGADAVMLSEETTIGKYPVEAVAMMEKVAMEAEAHLPEGRVGRSLTALCGK